MERRTRAAFTIAGGAFLAAVLVGIFAPAGGGIAPERLLARSAEVMARETFSFRGACDYCDEPTVLEYAPPERIRVTSGSPRGDNWPYYLYLDGTGYFSQEGKRWLTDGESGNAWLAGYSRIVDPRVLLTVVEDPEDQGSEVVRGRTTRMVSGGLDFEAMLAAVPAELRSAGGGRAREIWESATATFWIDTTDHRLLRLRVESPIEEFGEATLDYDFETPVDIPSTVGSMAAEEANRLGFEAEKTYHVLITAIAAYHRANGQYPPEVSPSTLAPFLDSNPWPANPFTGEPVRYEPGRPGNFDYRHIANGQHIIFQVDGWDGSQAYYDSERFGPIPVSGRSP
jgi:hypothetical protein